MPLKDRLGNILTADSTEPYSPRMTCGDCHDHEADVVGNGEWFQQGRTDVDGFVDMMDDYYGDGRYWIKSSGRYGKWGQSFQFLLASKDNTSPSDMDQTAFMWVKECAGCHSGGGPGEFDRDGHRFYDVATGQFGYELEGLTAGEVGLDGDYSMLDRSAATTSLAPWDVTGVSEPDCLLCHRDNRPRRGSVRPDHGLAANRHQRRSRPSRQSGATRPRVCSGGDGGPGLVRGFRGGRRARHSRRRWSLYRGGCLADAGMDAARGRPAIAAQHAAD